LKGGQGDLSYALKLLASGRSIETVWSEAGFASRKALAEEIYDLAARTSSRPLSVIAYSDGASLGNPGDAGCGAVIMDESGEVLLEDHRFLGRATNNVAEYEGAILALKMASEIGARQVELRLDSSLVVNQIKGGYRVKSRTLAVLYKNLKEMVEHFDRFNVTLVGRRENKRADSLANLAIAAHKGGGSETG
jgi:ribonuclease HI